MYIQHFGMAQYPFSLTPNTRYFLKLPSHQQAFNLLLAALAEEVHFAKIIGEVGTGKTMLCRKVLNCRQQSDRIGGWNKPNAGHVRLQQFTDRR